MKKKKAREKETPQKEKRDDSQKKDSPEKDKNMEEENEETREALRTEEEREKDVEREIRTTMHDEATDRRKSIYDLPSYVSSGPTVSDILKLSLPEIVAKPKIRYSVSLGMPGIARIDLSPLTQKIVGCVIGDDVTTEYPWVHVKKEIIEDNIDLHSESSEFLPMKDEIEAFPDTTILIGYAPSLQEKGQFYICLTEEGRNSVMRAIQTQRDEHESRVRNAVYKSARRWFDLGSGAEVDILVVKNTRPLFEIEVRSTADLLNMPMDLTDRKADDQRDGYIELLPYRQVFDNVWRKLVSKSMQVMPIMRHNEAQTGPVITANSWFQYLYEYQTIDLSTYTEDQTDSLKDFLRRYTEDVCDQVLLNSMWDIYRSDCALLVRSEWDTKSPVPIAYVEHQSYHEGKIIVDKIINSLCWHPSWTGIAMVAYTQHATNDYLIGPKTYDEVQLACQDNNRVLIWSFNDCLAPKVVLECPREVMSISVCPLDGAVIVGGCVNGQVAVWHIAGKIEQVEAVVIQTAAQAKYSRTMKSLMTWMHAESPLIRPVVMSSLKYSQKAGIIQILWIHPYYKIDRNGQIVSLPEDADEKDLSWQFATASLDGTIAFWDLKWRPSEREQRRQKKEKRIVTKPVSPLKVLDRIFHPDYMIVVKYPDNRQVVITMISMYSPRLPVEQIKPFVRSDDVTIRRHYKSIIEKPDFVMEPRILVGTVEGDFGCITWDGYEFATDVIMNRETARWLWIKKIHDGPVIELTRSLFYNEVVVTVGGRIFALWREDYGEPLFWNRSTLRYTSCMWSHFRPTVLILSLTDGTVEIWDFIIKSHKPNITQSVSGRIITGMYVHELPLLPQCIGFCDFTGSLRVFTAPYVLLKCDEGDIEWLKKFIDRQVQRIKEFKTWQQDWRDAHPELIEIKKELREMQEKKEHLEQMKIDERRAIEKAEREVTPTKPIARKPWQFLEETKARWMAIEVKRMQRVILEQKGLRRDVLEKQREPVMKLRQEAQAKKRKIREILSLQDKIFEESVTFLFPVQLPEEPKEEIVLLPPLRPTKDRRLTLDEFIKLEIALRKETIFEDPQEELIFNFLEVQTEALAKLKTTPFEHKFDWRKVLARGKIQNQI